MSLPTRVKICGLTRLEDAELAIELGADALGFVFWPGSRRAITAEQARAVIRALPPFPVRVGVFVNASPAEVARTVDTAGLDAIQLHGDELVADYAGLGRPLIKAVRLIDEAGSAVDRLPADVLPLVDAVDTVRRGGTGQRADWTRAARAGARRRIVLAGGLTADNVRAAVTTVRPWAVDVSSGVERAPGLKDPGRLRAFFASVREATVEGE